MLERYDGELSLAISTSQVRRPRAVQGGNGAARTGLNLMRRSLESVPPAELIDVYKSSHHSVAELWKHFGERTAVRLLDGATVLAVLWNSMWSDTGAPRVIEPSELRRFYLDERRAPSVRLDEMRVEGGELKIRL